MSEKRFIAMLGNKYHRIEDNETNSVYYSEDAQSIDWLVELLNNLHEENEQLRRLFEEMKQPITINLTEEDEKELRKLLGLIDDE